ncbi:hypothetical protein LTR50_005894 [Elasticomyces elasticus]|nr:hypothetical protein LTR50_005894 [Elasticomyces elasticus]
MTLKDLLKKKEKIKSVDGEHFFRPPTAASQPTGPDPPEFTFLRTTTTTQEIIAPPSFPGDTPPHSNTATPTPSSGPEAAQLHVAKRPHIFRRISSAAHGAGTARAAPSAEAEASGKDSPVRLMGERRLSHRLHLTARSRTSSSSSVSQHLPENLPEAPDAVMAVGARGSGGGARVEKEVEEKKEAEWEKRATILAMGNPLMKVEKEKVGHGRGRGSSVSDKGGDENIQEAIRLHERGEPGDLERSTAMFGRLADPRGANNALSQVLYGLALRHGWGIHPDPQQAIHYLSLAASNSASIESAALSSGLTKGGAAKGELVLAIFELANCFRHGWGVGKDPVAARQYYETAANLGDTDAMNEAAWCCLEGFGGKKDKFKAAQYLRLAEQKGNKTMGNTWIWKDKYDAK